MSSSLPAVLVGGAIGTGSTLVGTLLSHRFTKERERRNVALQGLRELAVVRPRMHKRDQLDLEADLATFEYQCRMAGVSAAVLRAYVSVVRHGAETARRSGTLDDAVATALARMDTILSNELDRPSRGRRRVEVEGEAAVVAHALGIDS